MSDLKRFLTRQQAGQRCDQKGGKLKDRDLYLQNVLTLTHPSSRFLLYCFEWQPR
jgi:hypothetical protein